MRISIWLINACFGVVAGIIAMLLIGYENVELIMIITISAWILLNQLEEDGE